MDILLRDLNPEDIEWIKKKTQNATSQNKFIKSLISEARIKEKLQLVRNSEKKIHTKIQIPLLVLLTYLLELVDLEVL